MMLLATAWLSIVLQLNVTASVHRLHGSSANLETIAYGFPWVYERTFVEKDYILKFLPSGEATHYYKWSLAGNALVGLVAVVVLTLGCKYLLDGILQVLDWRKAERGGR